MKTIQWFPGHMTKALRMMEENLRLVDGVIVILDAAVRLPASIPGWSSCLRAAPCSMC